MSNLEQTEIQQYINEKESHSVVSSLQNLESQIESLNLHEKNTKRELHLFEWLKNDKNLLSYSEIVLKNENELNFGEKLKRQLLELKLSITCPYFQDFKTFLEELKKGENLNIGNQKNVGVETQQSIEYDKNHGEDIQSETFCGVYISEIQSYPYYKNPKTGITRCSATAQMNGKNFGINLPSGNAYNAGKNPGKDSITTLPINKKNEMPLRNWPTLCVNDFQSVCDDANFADIFVESKSNYGHRAVAFKDSTGERYILDPYIRVNGVLNNKPKKLQEYLYSKKIVKANFYKSVGFVDKNLAYK